jgi:hypothetical protein
MDPELYQSFKFNDLDGKPLKWKILLVAGRLHWPDLEGSKRVGTGQNCIRGLRWR